eukprot:TRINITY_DN9776_c0_g1_i1.p1 TRINITY_DN9776_c0_g1~~TRINITY_DN9776_c0_g1_i1.p1  ORF type:complete len:143 (+),score=21.44 TRINITY_DN9776_c0_g1_i1:100-528(+)
MQKSSTAAVLSAVALVVAYQVDMFPVVFCVLVLVLMWTFGFKEGKQVGLSAYSHFNPNQEGILGTYRPNIDKIAKGESSIASGGKDIGRVFYKPNPKTGLEPYLGPPVNRNTACPCGSSLKYKKCCGDPKNLNITLDSDDEG